jgi:hypothetical protein
MISNLQKNWNESNRLLSNAMGHLGKAEVYGLRLDLIDKVDNVTLEKVKMENIDSVEFEKTTVNKITIKLKTGEVFIKESRRNYE